MDLGRGDIMGRDCAGANDAEADVDSGLPIEAMAAASRLLTSEEWLGMPPAGEGREEVVNVRTSGLASEQIYPVPEVRIVSPRAETIEVRRLSDRQFAVEKIVAEGFLEPARFPGVKIPVAEIWSE